MVLNMMHDKKQFMEIKKIKKLLNALLNISKNEIRSKLTNQKKLSESEVKFFQDFQSNQDNAEKSKDPDLQYQSVVLFNFSSYMI
jgi:hypothetical protein